MTGKEALIQVSKSCSGLALEFGNLKIGKTDNEALQKLKEIVQKYDKYKRAFEILKEIFGIQKSECKNRDTTYWVCAGDSADILTKEEYELLEELMVNENTK